MSLFPAPRYRAGAIETRLRTAVELLGGFGREAPNGARLESAGFCMYNNHMGITFDPAKRKRTLAERGLDFADAKFVFAGVTLEMEDTRKDYGEPRIVARIATSSA